MLNIDTFLRLAVTSAQCIFGTEKFSAAGILLIYDYDDYSQGYAQIREVFRFLTKDDVFQVYISDYYFRSSNVRVDDVLNTLHAFDLRYQDILTAAQPIKVEFKFNVAVPTDINGYALVLTNNIVSISSDGQKLFHLT